eukprot:1982207-Amphidinium_carterae.1
MSDSVRCDWLQTCTVCVSLIAVCKQVPRYCNHWHVSHVILLAPIVDLSRVLNPVFQQGFRHIPKVKPTERKLKLLGKISRNCIPWGRCENPIIDNATKKPKAADLNPPVFEFPRTQPVVMARHVVSLAVALAHSTAAPHV